MALTISNFRRDSIGSVRQNTFTVTGDSSYPTGGYSLAPISVGFHNVVGWDTDFMYNGTNGYVAKYNQSTNKLLFFDSTTGAPNPLVEVPNATNLSAYSATCTVYGT